MPDTTVLSVSVTAQQRVALGIGSEVSYFTGTHLFVPGSVLRGALAAAWIAENGPPAGGRAEEHFRELFDGSIRYGALYVLGSVVVPVSAWLCKYPKDRACKEQAADAAFGAVGDCAACGGPMEQGKGQVILPAGITPDRITRTSIDPKTGTAKDGELYAHGALPPATRLAGVIHGDDEWLEQPRQLRLGGRRTVGGAVTYTAVPAAPDTTATATAWDESGSLVVRLTSPGVFVDAAGRPRLDPDPHLDLGGAVVEHKWARPQIWSGWHAASGLPKPEEVCAVPGSTYRLAGPATLLRDLAESLPRDGAGLRRTEGFGDMQVVAEPWRPPAVRPHAQPATESDARALQLRSQVRDLNLKPELYRWVIDALRTLQLDRERPAAGQAADGAPPAESLADELLARPAAGDFSGRQRDALRTLFAEPDPGLLRDLTTLLLADRAGEAGDQ
jgi:CRISPR-associated protein Csx10